MSVLHRLFLASLFLPFWVSTKQIRYTDPVETVQEFPIQTEYQPVFGGSPDQDLSAESIGLEFEDSIIRSMLQIVDVKFNTLSTRMLSLERGVNSLQVYLSRQFRHVTKNLQAVNIVMNSLHAEVSHVDMETRSVRNSILALNKEFLDYRNRNLGVFRELSRVGHKKVPVKSINDSQKNFSQSQVTDQKAIRDEYKTSGQPVLLSTFRSTEELTADLGNDSIILKDMHTHIAKGLTKLNESVGKRFDELHNVTGTINENLVIISGSMAKINNTLLERMADKDEVNHLKNMMEYLTEKQDRILLDVSFLKEQTQSNKVAPGTGADQMTRTADDPQCQKTTSDKTGSVNLKIEFEKITDKLDMIDNRAEELNDNLVHTSEILESSRNHTEHVVKLVEALSGSTIWIPHILRVVKTTAKSLNESINATYIVYKQMMGLRSDTPPGDEIPGISDRKLEKSEHYQNGAANFHCKIDEDDNKLMRRQISKMEEILKKLDNSTAPQPEPTQKPTGSIYHVLLDKKEVRGNSTSGILLISSLRGLIHVCYDEVHSPLVASIACNQLEFSLGSPLIVPNVLMSTKKAFLINCLGRETTLDDCSFEMVSADYCKENGLLGVFCIE